MSVRVGLLQLRIDAAESVIDRIERVIALTQSCALGRFDGVEVMSSEGMDAARRPDVLVLPELWTVGAFNAEAMLANPEVVDGRLVARLQDVAREAGIWIHAGSIPERAADGARFNTAVLISPDGAVDATYRKVHLFGFDEGEAVLLESGADLVVRPTPLGVTGLATCYDLRFPELFRGLLDAGAETFVVASGWPLARIEHWRVLLRARAIEDQAWVAACNQVGTHAGVVLGGRSAVVDPSGEVVVEGPTDRECLVLADVDPSAAARTRMGFPVLRDRRL
jgi:predicted amidohydrolase